MGTPADRASRMNDRVARLVIDSGRGKKARAPSSVPDSLGAVMPAEGSDAGSRGIRLAKPSKVSPVSQTRGVEGLMLVKNRRIRSPLVGRVGKESTWSRSLRAR